MRLRSIPLFLVLAVTAVLAVMNWSVIVSPTTLSIGARTVEAPLGLVMLGLMALLCLSFIVYALSLHGWALAESRRRARELEAQRELADKAEVSRITELRNFMSAELLRVTQAEDAMRTQILARLDVLEQQSRTALSESMHELEDRLERYTPGADRSH
jgi:biopolymer transport protein ExbB/TolQ